MAVQYTQGTPKQGILEMEHGLLRSKKKHMAEVTAKGVFQWHKTADVTSPIVESYSLRSIMSAGRLFEQDDASRTEFVIGTDSGSHVFRASTHQDMLQWISCLQPPAPSPQSSTSSDERVCGRLGVNGGKDRWCVLRKSSFVMFKSKDDSDPIGAISLDALCTVIPPSSQSQATSVRRATMAGHVFKVNTATKEWSFKARTLSDANRWIGAIQDAIESCPPLTTKFMKLVSANSEADAFAMEEITMEAPILCYSDEPLSMPCTTIPYGIIGKRASGNTYGLGHIEALEIFNSMTPGGSSRYGSLDNAFELIKALVAVCKDVLTLRNEILAQCIKQITRHPKPDSPEALVHWHIIAGVLVHFTPSGKLAGYARASFRSVIASTQLPQAIKKGAHYCIGRLSSEQSPVFHSTEVQAILSGKAFAEAKETKVLENAPQVGRAEDSNC